MKPTTRQRGTFAAACAVSAALSTAAGAAGTTGSAVPTGLLHRLHGSHRLHRREGHLRAATAAAAGNRIESCSDDVIVRLGTLSCAKLAHLSAPGACADAITDREINTQSSANDA